MSNISKIHCPGARLKDHQIFYNLKGSTKSVLL
jgi:hypothetical protein